MYLKSIEMQGFKSFADKTKVVFDQGVTAVVGPNGSGKSNITESLRWALGESSAKSLRGGKMPDVIFAGTENRKPLNYASVTVTLDNKSGFIKDKKEEIKVERHIYRSGDSEYLIDGQKVRLRDIHDLFMDTGLGRDSFSIISQGRVEAIFNSKPEERRAIFEEAAGVLKYKTRKKETETKLNQTQDNLDRLEDIIYELENQVKPLKKQAETAKRFLELDEERKDLYLNVLVAQISAGRTNLTLKEDQLGQVKAELSAYYEECNRLEEENQALKDKRHHLNETMTRDQATLLDLTKLISDLEGKIELHKLESSQNESSKQEAMERQAALKETISQLESQVAEKKESLDQTATDLAQLSKEIADKKTELDRFSDDPDQVIEHLREAYVALMQEEAESSNELAKVEQERENLLALADSKASQVEKLKADQESYREQVQASQEALSKAEMDLRSLLDTYQAKEKEQAAAQADYQVQQNQLYDLLDQIKTKRARVASLEAILKNHSNFYAGVKAVLQQSSQIGGIVGAVSEHLSFSADYQTALEIALGTASQNVIVEDEQAARSAINFLKKNRQGRATFLPLTTIKPRQIAQQHVTKLQAAQGFLGRASDLVTYEARLDNIFQNLLGATAIFDTIEHANQAARATNFQVRMVTLDGSEIRPGGAFAGGANRQNNTIFIKPELDALTAEIEADGKALRQQERSVQAQKKQLDSLNQEIEAIKTAGEEARLTEQRLRLQSEQLASRLEEVSLLYQLEAKEVGQDQLTGLLERQAALEADLLDFKQKKTDLMAQIDQVKDNRDAIQEQVHSLQTALSGLTLRETQLKSEQGFEEANLSRLESELATAHHDVAVLQSIIDQKVEAQDDTSLEVLESQLAESLEKQTAISQRLIRLKFELEDIEGQFEDLEEHFEQARSKNDELIRRQAKLEADCEQLTNRLSGLMLELTDQYKLSFEAAQEAAEDLEDLSAAEQVLKKLQADIRALGPVNLDAIEQYDEVNDRLTFLTTQRQDVLNARDLLLSTIHDMDDEVKERFKGTFDAIRSSFQTTFKQMFGGGSADLVLTSSDLLTAGVEISVQPPGKKIQSLNLMSGGEKALSALALLFSIIRVKTIPFVILDEVEAALDEANVKRFGDYLNRFDKNSQFIVVTHRKGTMAAADAIYGVTMQESGVSKIVSVKLKDAEGMVE